MFIFTPCEKIAFSLHHKLRYRGGGAKRPPPSLFRWAKGPALRVKMHSSSFYIYICIYKQSNRMCTPLIAYTIPYIHIHIVYQQTLQDPVKACIHIHMYYITTNITSHYESFPFSQLLLCVYLKESLTLDLNIYILDISLSGGLYALNMLSKYNHIQILWWKFSFQPFDYD